MNSAQFSVQGQVAIVTGAAGGLGKEVAKILAAAQAHVVLVDVHQEGLEQLAKEISQEKQPLMVERCDVTKSLEIHRLIQRVDETFQRIDILINCAGILGADASLFEIKEEDWDRVLNVNLKGTWLTSTAIAKYMVQHHIKGKIINISSALGERTQLKRVHYATSKAGVEHLTRLMAMELVHEGIRVNCLAPGWIETDMVREILEGPEGAKWREAIPMGRAAKPEELTGALLLLASEASSYMTGSVLQMDGGYAYRGIELRE
jgi:3-oxoacyl-[acyl-carrier protein] reductase